STATRRWRPSPTATTNAALLATGPWPARGSTSPRRRRPPPLPNALTPARRRPWRSSKQTARRPWAEAAGRAASRRPRRHWRGEGDWDRRVAGAGRAEGILGDEGQGSYSEQR